MCHITYIVRVMVCFAGICKFYGAFTCSQHKMVCLGLIVSVNYSLT